VSMNWVMLILFTHRFIEIIAKFEIEISSFFAGFEMHMRHLHTYKPVCELCAAAGATPAYIGRHHRATRTLSGAHEAHLNHPSAIAS